MKKFPIIFLISAFLNACISISVDDSRATSQPNFITATLIPTKPGFVHATMTSAPGGTSPADSPTVTPPANCLTSAVLLRDVTIPDDTKMDPGEQFTKTWEFQNNGTCPWVNFTIKYAAGDQMNAPLSSPVEDTAPGEKVQISVELTAPSADGSYTGYFTLNGPSGTDVPIGIEKTFWVKIQVGSGTSQTTPIGASGNTPQLAKGGSGNCQYAQNAAYVQQVIALINQARSAAGLTALAKSQELMTSAQAHSADMACNNFLDHAGSDGSWINDRLATAGYSGYTRYSEIIATGSPQIAMDQWKADKPHWDAVLDPGVTEIGAGYAYLASSDYLEYITVDMGSR